MKRIFIILCLFGLILNVSAQDSELERDIIKAEVELIVRDTPIVDLIEEHTSGSLIDGANGLSKSGNNIEMGGNPFNKNVVIPGAGYDVEIGTTGSKAGNIQFNAGSDIYINADGIIEIQANGATWEYLGGNLIVNQNTGDTLAVKSDIQAIVDASTPYIPYNFQYTFDPTITDSRPGPGLFRLNNATYSLVTQIYIDAFDTDNVDQSDFISEPDTGSYISIYDGTNYVNYKLTGALTAASSYYKYEVTYSNNSGVISGLNTISLDLSNSVGGAGGLSDKLASITDTIQLRNDTLLMTEQVLDAKTVIGDTHKFGTSNYMIDAPQNNIFNWDIGNSWYEPHPSFQANSWYYGTTDPTGATRLNWDGHIHANQLYNNVGVLRSFTTTNSSIFNLTFSQPTLSLSYFTSQTSGAFYTGVVNPTSTDRLNYDGNLHATNLSADTAEVWVIKWKDGTGSVSGNDTSGKFVEDTAEVKVLIVGEGAVKDTSVGFVDPQTDIETMEFNQLNFSPVIPTASEGRFQYDSNDRAFVGFNGITGFKEEFGRGINIIFYNNTGSTLNDGTIIRSIGAKVNGSITFIADLAGIGSLDSLNGIAMVTATTLNNTFGVATLIGQINGLNTSIYSDNQILYMSHAGTYDTIRPEAPYISQIVGRVQYADADSGAIFFYGFSESKFDPSPVYSAFFNDSLITLTNPGQNSYALITNASDSLFGERLNYGFERSADSVRVLQNGIYDVGLTFSFYGDASQPDLWHIGVFKNGVLEFKISRTSSTTNRGGVPFTIPISLTTSDWISFKIANTTSAARQAVFVDAAMSLEYITGQ